MNAEQRNAALAMLGKMLDLAPDGYDPAAIAMVCVRLSDDGVTAEFHTRGMTKFPEGHLGNDLVSHALLEYIGGGSFGGPTESRAEQ
jgi:hypothetical protein